MLSAVSKVNNVLKAGIPDAICVIRFFGSDYAGAKIKEMIYDSVNLTGVVCN